ncbi:MAG TPA: hypothetical protein VKV73_07465 [Chloroflexota bacterium]|nr:hypothetical protein [Chloroflexota bacterium]
MSTHDTALETFATARTAPTWRARLGFAQLAAAIMARLHKQPEVCEPDPYGTEMPFLTDSWPRG